MKNDCRRLVGEVFSDVIERLAFMFSEEVGEEEFSMCGARFLEARIRFAGAMTGELSLVVSEEMGSMIAANMLGVDVGDEVGKARIFDALREVINVTCGHVLTECAGDAATFELSVPSVCEMEDGGGPVVFRKPGAVKLLVDDYPVVLNFSLED